MTQQGVRVEDYHTDQPERGGRVLSGMRPSGKLHLGNWVGALRHWVELQREHECFYFVADWHALTTDYADTTEIRRNVTEMAMDWLAAGLDPERSTLFIQSLVPEHAELHLLLSMITPLSWLERVPSYKEMQQELAHRDLATYGFLGYPMLQAADILIYRAHWVPVGADQVAHIELTREVARRFNHLYGKVFPEPAPKLTEVPVLPGVDGRKMSKSYNNAIYLSDPPEVVAEKVRETVTDPARVRRHDPGTPEKSNVYAYHQVFSSAEDVAMVHRECQTAGIGCVDCKNLLLKNLMKVLEPLHRRRRELEEKPEEVREILHEGSRKAQKVAAETLHRVKEAMKL